MAYVPDVRNNMHIHFDRFAILLSGLCAIHCIALPIVASLIPLLSSTIQHGHNIHEFWFHEFILFFILPISFIALITGYRSHNQWTPIIIAGVGLFILTMTSLFIEEFLAFSDFPYQFETVLTVTGGVIHALGHILNVQATRNIPLNCAHCNES